MSTETSFTVIELLIARMAEAERGEAICSSLAWSFAMSIGQSIARLQRMGDDDDEFMARLNDEDRLQRITDLEVRTENFEALLSWAARQANPEFMPSGQDVADRITQPDERVVEVDPAMVEEYAKEMGASHKEVRAALKANNERNKAEQALQIMAAKQQTGEIIRRVDAAIASIDSPGDVIDVNDAIRIVDRIAEKAATYAEKALASALGQRRARRRDALNAMRRIYLDIEGEADGQLDILERLRDGQSDEAPVERLAREMS